MAESLGNDEDTEMHDAQTSIDATKSPPQTAAGLHESPDRATEHKSEETATNDLQAVVGGTSAGAITELSSKEDDPRTATPTAEATELTERMEEDGHPSSDQSAHATNHATEPSEMAVPAHELDRDRKPNSNDLAASHPPNPAVAKVQPRPISRAGSVTSHTNGEQGLPASKNTGAPSRVYLKEQVNDWLLEGMRWLVHARPKNGLLALGSYLQSADQWRSLPGNEKKETADFQKYWSQFQNWQESNPDKDEREFRASVGL